MNEGMVAGKYQLASHARFLVVSFDRSYRTSESFNMGLAGAPAGTVKWECEGYLNPWNDLINRALLACSKFADRTTMDRFGIGGGHVVVSAEKRKMIV
ncbi:hypothetical protein LTR09_003956 [Extremus antarcticus]|uniref:Uncharacterized protein n=1 Tax=Extremus antarcticus TaxID=702011 RepID=A0AAJ0DIL3_9PEZI|nr:hypothetical protein LTR09_003956 [Extremus antarcticus]